ncbi:AraC family transcriptional regulator [Afifella sp. H1R]|uniref:AraC family transcriptional regulator n=1 Tax=Afifella sp. H1R TaxID=2908841 RepID=UPI001F483FB3|nr:AraC family transcriptional regulator [Afifella sp. H1R]MCF1503682.1 AraC family transcriptional regulator [Afifella sp. H1R]
MTDPLTQIVTLLQPQAVLMTEIHGAGRWGIRFPGFGVTNFVVVAEGACWLKLGDETPMPFREGDFLLQPAAGTFAFSSAPDSETVLGDAAYKQAAGPIIRLGTKDATATRLVGGYCTVDRVNADLFTALLPRAIHIQSDQTGADRFGRLMQDIADEARGDRPGRTLILQRLVEVLVLEALRRPTLIDHIPSASGLLAALRDRSLSAALRALHDDVRAPWTVSKLAGVAGMSRSAFSPAFHNRMGMTPMTYLTSWRMALAKAALIHERLTLEEVADRTGYGSAGAFSHAFLRSVGQTPSAFRRKWA